MVAVSKFFVYILRNLLIMYERKMVANSLLKYVGGLSFV